jgi:hypothetical protein
LQSQSDISLGSAWARRRGWQRPDIRLAEPPREHNGKAQRNDPVPRKGARQAAIGRVRHADGIRDEDLMTAASGEERKAESRPDEK